MARNQARHQRALAKVYKKVKALISQDEVSEEGGRAAEAVQRLTPTHQVELAWHVAENHSDEFEDFLFELPTLPAAALSLERILLCVG